MSDLDRYSEAAAQMADPDRYAAVMALTFDQRHPCPVDECRLSAEEHHRLAFGQRMELLELRRRVAALENGAQDAHNRPLTASRVDLDPECNRDPDRPPTPTEAACWLNADCIRGYHGCLDEDGCQFATTSGDL